MDRKEREAQGRMLPLGQELASVVEDFKIANEFLQEQQFYGTPCSGCEHFVHADSKFCGNCRTPNAYFQLVAFGQMYEGTVDEVIEKECRGSVGHRGQTTNFCITCGEKLSPTAEDYTFQREAFLRK